ncbi:MAG: SAM-dependent DNA methyltransferase [Bacteroidetes bacterium]|nr:SAM-dependent DNA methyltransferase [Bacteroidota bacterium]
MKEYQSFIEDLKSTIKSHAIVAAAEWKNQAILSVNGLAAEKLRGLVPLEIRRASGAFFTSSELGARVLKSQKLKFGKEIIFYDPACGAGNLLIAAQKEYAAVSAKNKLEACFTGTDIHDEFVEACKIRLGINDLLLNRASCDYGNMIVNADGLEDNFYYKAATHVLTNPPFNLIDSPHGLTWASGKVSAAALFVDAIVKYCKPGTQVVAILPDVLRSGSRYEKWRQLISRTCDLTNIELWGQFDEFADVDVFSVLFTIKAEPSAVGEKCWTSKVAGHKTISDSFTVCVGPVVDNRDEHEGTERPYIVSRGLPGWQEVSQFNRKRKHKGVSFISPFVVVKRTSRRGDNHRAIATIIKSKTPVYVDNHLIVLIPISGKLKDCKALLKSLKRNATDKWIDTQIRCRHLTVKVVSNIPL